MKTKPITLAAITRQLAEIGDAIATQYAAGTCRKYRAPGFIYGVTELGERVKLWGDHVDFVEFTVGTHKARCIDSPEAVADIVRKYRKGPNTRLKRAWSPALPKPDRSGCGTDYGAVDWHETIPDIDAT